MLEHRKLNIKYQLDRLCNLINSSDELYDTPSIAFEEFYNTYVRKFDEVKVKAVEKKEEVKQINTVVNERPDRHVIYGRDIGFAVLDMIFEDRFDRAHDGDRDDI